MTGRALIVAAAGVAAFSTGCAFGGAQSGWELIPERAWSLQMRSFPEMPMSFPEPPQRPPTDVRRTPIRGAFTHALDQDSLFRRGYSAPTP